jgi:putative hydroxymethylpyrimidine transport system substrate-binding protein
MHRLAVALMAAAVALASLLAGCGSSGGAPSELASATLILDFTPNAVHAGIYEALARGDDVRAGVRLHVVAPSASTDPIRLLETGRANFAILDIHDLAIARERGKDIVGIMALVQRPLAAVIAAPGIHSPRQLAGRTVGVSGVPSDTAVLRSVVTGAGGAPKRVQTITIGFNAVAALLAGRVAGATAFWNDEGVTVQRARPGFHVFRVDRYRAPSYPELILCATGRGLRSHPGLARAVVHALTTGYEQVLRDPPAGARALESLVPGLDPQLQDAELRALLPSFDEPGGRIGALDPGRLRAWARWEVRFGIVTRRPDLGAMFRTGFLPKQAARTQGR